MRTAIMMVFLMLIPMLSWAQTAPPAPEPEIVGTILTWTHDNLDTRGNTRVPEGFKIYYGPQDQIDQVIDIPDPAALLDPVTNVYKYDALATPALANKKLCFQATAYYMLDTTLLESVRSMPMVCATIAGSPSSPNEIRITN